MKLPWVIGVGASAGGLEALSSLISNLPTGFPGALVVAQHLAPKSKSMMTELLARQTTTPVMTALNGQKIERGQIYVIPPNMDAEIVDQQIVLTEAGPETRPKPSVDSFFSSLARTYGERAIGIILSGTGSDGSEGIRAIRAGGGMTIAQDHQSAKYDGMPHSAVQTGSVDSILAPEYIGKNIVEILDSHFYRHKLEAEDDDTLLEVLDVLKKSGRDFTEYKLSTIRRRFAKRMSALGIASAREYLSYLERTPGEVAQLAQEMLVSVTTFFRDPEIWDELKKVMFEIYQRKEHGSEFRVWVAGCATGEEAYSLAMVLADLQSKHNQRLNVKVFATDLDQDAILEARNGVYDIQDLKNVSASFRTRFFNERSGTKVEIVKAIRDTVVFARQDLVQNPPFVKLDLVTCRNVLIYFEPSLQKRVLETFHYSLAPGGFLALGKSESPVGCAHLFEAVDKKGKLYKKLESTTRPTLNLSFPRSTGNEIGQLPKASEAKGLIPEKAYAKLIQAYELAGAIIDPEGNVLHWLGDVSPYTKMTAGLADFRLPSLLPKGVGIEIPILIKKAQKTRGTFRSRAHEVGEGASRRKYKIAVRALADDDKDLKFRGLYLVNFEPFKKPELAPAPTVSESELPLRFAELEQELHQTREHLQTVIEELGVSNEELQSLNEELSSTNEELQASNEELETTNEELQSSNEELTTVNEELAVKTTELRQHHSELSNIYSSIGSGVIVVDQKLRVLRFNDEAAKIFTLSAKSLRENITRISANCELPDFKEKIEGTIASGQSSEAVCEGPSSIYQLRIVPFMDDQSKIIGAILVFFDNTAMLKTRKLLEASESRVTSIINSSQSLISLKDRLGRYILVNRAFTDYFGLDADRIIGKTDNELFDQKSATRMRDADLTILLKHESIQTEEKLRGQGGHEGSFLVNRFHLTEPGAYEPYAVGMVAVDIRALVETQKALRESETRYRAIVEEQSVFVCRIQMNGKLNYVNSAFMQFFNVSSSHRSDLEFKDVIHPSDRREVQWALQAISPMQSTSQHDHRYLSRDGAVRWIRWIYRGIFNANGETTEYQAVGFDVTEIRAQADELIEKDAVFKSLFSNTSDFMAIFRVIGDDIVLESLNRSAEKSYGMAFNQLVGRKLQDFLGEKFDHAVLDRYRVAIESGSAQVVEEDVVVMGHRRQLLTTIVPIPGASGEIERVAAVSRDVSPYKEIENDLRKAMQLADVANQAKSDFLASMSHELRTPLNVVLGMAHLLGESQLDEEQNEYVGSINRSGQLLLGLIEDVLDISRIESGKVRLTAEPFRVGEIAKEIGELFSIQAAEKGVSLSINVERDSDLYVIGDAARLRQIVVNLVGNALKFTDYGRVNLLIKATGQEVAGEQLFRFQVSDTGVGIKKEFHSRIFQKFSQADSGDTRRFGGSGLGLVISKHLATLMNGEIGFESEYGEGSTFWFTARLQLTTKQEVEQRRSRQASAGRSAKWEHRPLKILAVDDNVDSLNVVRLFLRRLGHDAEPVGSAADAIKKLSEEKFDLVLMDVQMPGMDGLEATKKIRSMNSSFSKIPIIALTAKAMSGDADRCFGAGMSDYLTKPVQMKSLKALLARWAFNLTNDPGKFENS